MKEQFNSINDFLNALQEREVSNHFLNMQSSIKQSFDFTQTYKYEDAIDLLKNGWNQMAEKINSRMILLDSKIGITKKTKTNYDVVGFQASVPRYLQGIPTNMVNKKQIIQKQKVITINKSISYPSSFKTEQIMEHSIKALQIVKAIEESGIRVNLNIIFSATTRTQDLTLKIRIKSANERLNISKMAFPLVHPSMLRRLVLRYVETAGLDSSWVYGYGTPKNDIQLKRELENEKEYYISRFIDCDAKTFIKENF